MENINTVNVAKGLTISRKSDGTWLNFESNGKSACVNIETKFGHTSIIKDAILGWAKEQFALEDRTGPKQGDPVWFKFLPTDKWAEAQFISEYNGFYFLMCGADPVSVRYMTTTNPHAIKYELTPPQATQALIDGKYVTGDRFVDKRNYLKLSADINYSICAISPSKGTCVEGSISLNQMYAIVEE